MTRQTHPASGQTQLDKLAPDQLIRINRCCDEYEGLWKSSNRVSLEDFLSSVSADDKSLILPELILIDIEYRCRQKHSLNADDYLQFSQDLDRTWLQKQLESVTKENLESNQNSELLPGTVVGDYQILDELGEGGMGKVFRAVHVLMKRQVALKVIHHQGQSDPHLKRRFEREVMALASLSHPNILTAHDARQSDGFMYLVTELIEGVDLGRLIRSKGPLTALKAAHYAWQAAKGLQYAHEQGIIHRDIKPENLIIDRKQSIKILDLGIARLRDGKELDSSQSTLTHSHHVLGTALYMAPEQARFATVADVRSDIYSLGCTMFFLLAGKPPYTGESAFDTLLAHREIQTPSVAKTNVHQLIPSELDGLVQRMMAKQPSDRPVSMLEVAIGLADIVRQLKRVSHPNEGAITRLGLLNTITATHRRKRMRWTTIAVSCISAAIVVLLIAFMFLTPATTPERKKRSDASANEKLQFTNAQSGGSAVSMFDQLIAASKNSKPKTASVSESSSGILFDGRTNFIDFPTFDEPIGPGAMIEALVRAATPIGQAENVVTWNSRDELFALFRAYENHWGIAHFDGKKSRLIIAEKTVNNGSEELIGGAWDGQRLKLFLNGMEVNSHEMKYDLYLSMPHLFIGGIPDGILPTGHGTRYFRGDIARVRLSRNANALTFATKESDLVVDSKTIALFDLREVNGKSLFDLNTKWRGTFFGQSTSSSSIYK